MEEKIFENKIWDTRADAKVKGDNLRTVLPSREYKDEFGRTHYIFSKQIFQNSKYIIPNDDFTLFYNFLNGGSREYPSDGNIPVDVVAEETRLVLGRIKEIANDPSHKFHSNAVNLLNSKNELQLIRGTMKFYLGEYTTRDWRRKRSTDDLDFWIVDQSLFGHVITEMGYVKNKHTKEWEKKVTWVDPWTGILQSGVLIASDDINQGLDFGAGAYLEGSSLKDNLKKKMYRGLDVDLSDIINTAILNNIPESPNESSPWAAFKECCNMRHSRVISNTISLCRFSRGIAGYLERVGRSIQMFKETVKNPNNIPNQDILMICRVSSHLLKVEDMSTPESTRDRIYKNLVVQEQRKIEYSNNLRQFGDRILELLNQKFVETVFEIV
jgi:hypothetical protein